MRVFLVLCALVACVVASPVANGGQSRIIGGTTAVPGQFPHSASVRDYENAHLCGGFIHRARWIVTVAACTWGRTISNTQVVVGTNSLTSGGFDYALSRIINQPNFSTDDFSNDIALLETIFEIDWYPNVQPIGLGTATTVAGITGTVAGWGRTQEEGTFSNNLQWMTLSTLSTEACRDRHSAISQPFITDQKICTNNVEGLGMCVGDAGSALVSGPNAIGIVSWGLGCATGAPDVFTRVSAQVPWINGIINAQ